MSSIRTTPSQVSEKQRKAQEITHIRIQLVQKLLLGNFTRRRHAGAQLVVAILSRALFLRRPSPKEGLYQLPEYKPENRASARCHHDGLPSRRRMKRLCRGGKRAKGEKGARQKRKDRKREPCSATRWLRPDNLCSKQASAKLRTARAACSVRLGPRLLILSCNRSCTTRSWRLSTRIVGPCR